MRLHLFEGGAAAIYLIGADGERDILTVQRKMLRAFGSPEDDFDWVRDRPGGSVPRVSVARLPGTGRHLNPSAS